MDVDGGDLEGVRTVFLADVEDDPEGRFLQTREPLPIDSDLDGGDGSRREHLGVDLDVSDGDLAVARAADEEIDGTGRNR